MNEIERNRYLSRIDYDGPIRPPATVLSRLHRAHMRTVPFENLSIQWGERIVLDEAALFDKIVNRRRGGFCYELNGLFAALLDALGFEVTMLQAEVARPDGEFGPPFDHMILRVDLDEPWLADVGFGDSFLTPLRLAARAAQEQGRRAYRLRDAGPYRLLQQRDGDAEWATQFRFTLTPHKLADYDSMCRYHQTSPDSSFTQRLICSRATSEGRVTVSDDQLIITRHGEREERQLADAAAVRAALATYFGINKA